MIAKNARYVLTVAKSLADVLGRRLGSNLLGCPSVRFLEQESGKRNIL